MMTMTTMMMTTMTTRMATTRKKNLRNLRNSAAHPVRLPRHHIVWIVTLFVCLVGVTLVAIQANALRISAGTAAQKRRPSPDDCILYATVFTEKGARLPDATFTAHAAGKTKPHWDGFSDGRGEFAVRVSFQGDYEIEVKAKGYDPQTRKVTSEAGQKLDVVFNLVPRTLKKP
jgi:carboxypeptidase family protein